MKYILKNPTEEQINALKKLGLCLYCTPEGIHYVDVPEIKEEELTEGLVDLGLSVKWSSYNIGANKPFEYGKLFQFGRADGYYYNDFNHKFYVGEDIPTTTSALTNDSGFITNAALTGYATEDWVNQKNYLTSVSWGDISDKPTLVTTDTEQTITGNKVFTGTLQAASLSDGTTTKTMTEVLAGGGGSTTYMHVLKLSGKANRSLEAWTTIYTKSETPFDKDSLSAWFTAKGLTTLPASGSGKGNSRPYSVRNIKYGKTEYSSSSVLHFEYIDPSYADVYTDIVVSVEDNVVAVD